MPARGKNARIIQSGICPSRTAAPFEFPGITHQPLSIARSAASGPAGRGCPGPVEETVDVTPFSTFCCEPRRLDTEQYPNSRRISGRKCAMRLKRCSAQLWSPQIALASIPEKKLTRRRGDAEEKPNWPSSPRAPRLRVRFDFERPPSHKNKLHPSEIGPVFPALHQKCRNGGDCCAGGGFSVRAAFCHTTG